ncbi:formate hydrogenlyase subunit 6 [Salmonella enterica subsp. enterica serovar Madelia]|nr:formate hydrogenlyase subunit 6 [Salmonella enterica subsp. enterica serovar Madelia]
MFTFIKKVIKTGTATSSYPLEPIAVDKNFRGKPEHNPQQCIGCAACVNACPSNALTVETDLATNELGVAVQSWPLYLLRSLRRGVPDGGD